MTIFSAPEQIICNAFNLPNGNSFFFLIFATIKVHIYFIMFVPFSCEYVDQQQEKNRRIQFRNYN